MAIPWFVKIPAKIALSRLPVKYDAWRSLNLFRAGGMDDPETAFRVFQMHCDAAGFSARKGYTVLELGPGDSILTALLARSAGAGHTILVDQSPLAAQDVGLFARAEGMLSSKGRLVPGVAACASIEDVMCQLDCSYLTGGIESLRTLPGASVDFMFSNAVIEHVRKRDFAEMARELCRVMKSDGVASHWIDYRDHLQLGLNNLRFSESLWETDFFANSGFYTNRLTAADIRRNFEDAGFTVEVRDSTPWPNGLPTPQSAMSKPFSDMPAEDLMVMTNWLLLRKSTR